MKQFVTKFCLSFSYRSLRHYLTLGIRFYFKAKDLELDLMDLKLIC